MQKYVREQRGRKGDKNRTIENKEKHKTACSPVDADVKECNRADLEKGGM